MPKGKRQGQKWLNRHSPDSGSLRDQDRPSGRFEQRQIAHRVRGRRQRRVSTFCAGDQAAVPAQAWIILVVGALISFLGVPAGLIGNELSIRYGLRIIATLVFLLSAFAGGLFGFTAMLP